MVIHTDAPRDAESYTHRAGRTGRAGRKGRSVLLASPQRRNKVDFILRRAKLTMQWQDVPTAAAVEKSLAKRARRHLRESLAAAPAPDAKQLAHATALLEEMDASTLVARLVELSRERHKTAPREVTTATVTSRAQRGPGNRRYDQNKPDRGRPAHRERNFSARVEHFEINWGRRDGATPQRLVALLCRRGDITSRMIGAIDIARGRTTFEVAGNVAHQFEQSAQLPDSRDPDLVIRRSVSNRR
jgi:ATP-dependent RNA helicase DeaD